MNIKDRWMKLAGITPKSPTKSKQNLKEGFVNLGMASPGIMGNPFGRGAKSLAEEQEQDEDQIKTRKYGEDKEEDMEVNESQLAVDPFEGHPERGYNGPDYDPSQNPEIQALPRQIGSPLDDEFSLDNFDPEEEGLSERPPKYYKKSDDEDWYGSDDEGWYGLEDMSPEERDERERRVFGASNSAGRRGHRDESHKPAGKKNRHLKERVESADELQQELKRLIYEADDIFGLLLDGKTKYNRQLLKVGRGFLRKCSRAVLDATSSSLNRE